MSSVPSTYPEDSPVIEAGVDFQRDGQSGLHPHWAAQSQTDFGDPRKLVRSHARGSKAIEAYRRKAPTRSTVNDAPPTNFEPVELLGGKTS